MISQRFHIFWYNQSPILAASRFYLTLANRILSSLLKDSWMERLLYALICFFGAVLEYYYKFIIFHIRFLDFQQSRWLPLFASIFICKVCKIHFLHFELCHLLWKYRINFIYALSIFVASDFDNGLQNWNFHFDQFLSHKKFLFKSIFLEIY